MANHPFLDAFNDMSDTRRAQAVEDGLAAIKRGEIQFSPAQEKINLHIHTFFSFNGEGYSPSYVAWKAKQEGLKLAGIVDFDVLDGVEEFLDICQKLDLKGTAGIETRVFVPEFAEAVINSPGEPGVAYHMGVGMPHRKLKATEEHFLMTLRETSARRNRELIERVNAFTAPLTVDYDQDVLPHTPNGNATERHICKVYALKAADYFSVPNGLIEFWSEKLGTAIDPSDLPDKPKLLDRIRAKTMKRGGAGYVQPDATSFPLMKDMNTFVAAAGGIPCVAWLDGLSDGEQRMAELLDVAMSTGVAAINIIPDRNYTPGVVDQKLKNLQEVIALAQERDLPVVVGTEMNAPGQKFVDAFETAELSPLLPVFMEGAYIVYAHTALQRYAGFGYLSAWAVSHFPDRKSRNMFFAHAGRDLQPSRQSLLMECRDDARPDDVLRKIKA